MDHFGTYLDAYGEHVPERLRAEQQRVVKALKESM
jgi:hypothetical protein